MNLVDDVGKNVSSLYRYKSNGKKKKSFLERKFKMEKLFRFGIKDHGV